MSKVLKIKRNVTCRSQKAVTGFQPKSISDGLRLIAPDLLENADRHLAELFVISLIFIMIFFGVPLIGAFLHR